MASVAAHPLETVLLNELMMLLCQTKPIISTTP